MLSAHELATLMLVKAGNLAHVLDRVELDVLHKQQLITVERGRNRYIDASLTSRGDAILHAISQGHSRVVSLACESRQPQLPEDSRSPWVTAGKAIRSSLGSG